MNTVKHIGGFSKEGRGTPEGPAKDRKMREIADSCIVELSDNNSSSSKTTLDTLGEYNCKKNQIVMLARNAKLKGKPLKPKTIDLLNLASQNNCKFIVGDFPDVDEQFVKHLISVDADVTIYHSGNEPRIKY